MKRISNLRSKALNTSVSFDEFKYKFWKHFEQKTEISPEIRFANAYYGALSDMVPSLSDGELIVGKCGNILSENERAEWEEQCVSAAYGRECEKVGMGQDSHMAIDFDLLLKCGISGIIKKIDACLLSCAKEKEDFYIACRKCMEAIIKYSQNYAAEAERQANEEKDENRKAELEKIAEICKKVPENPAENFYEALQSVNFVTYCLTLSPFRGPQQFQLGRPDRYLYQFYSEDIKNGIITSKYAQLLLDCFGIQINMRVPNGLSCGYMVGGCDENGKAVENELTYMCMQVIKDIRLVYPAVGLCYTESMSDMCMETACEILALGCSHPAVFNDDIISKGLQNYGIPEKDSHNYIHSTCVEITPIASSNVWVASPYTNMPQLLLDCLEIEYKNFDGLMSALFEKIDGRIKQNFEDENKKRKLRAENSVNPVLSCFVHDCLEKGCDIECGGAKYNWIMPSFVGIANLVDSLYALKTVVFDLRELTLPEFKKILDNNFEGHETLRMRLLNSIPKYGNDVDDVDKYFGIITKHIASECEKYTAIHSNGKIIPSVFCWIKHEFFGSKTGATPDGRKSGFPLGDGSGACQGREFNRPTASILSSVKWEHYKFIGGVAVNMKFSKKSLGNNSINIMKNFIKTYMKKGGFEIQINVTDKEILEKAVERPEEYSDLIVRIGGYSDYFVRLSRNMQKEIILRTEHKI